MRNLKSAGMPEEKMLGKKKTEKKELRNITFL